MIVLIHLELKLFPGKLSFQIKLIRYPYTKEIGMTCKNQVQEIKEKREQALQQEIAGYHQRIAEIKEKEIPNLVRLTDWNIEEIRKKITLSS